MMIADVLMVMVLSKDDCDYDFVDGVMVMTVNQ